MPDSQGRYTTTDMYDRVRRLMNRKQQTINPATGAETSAVIVGQDISNTDILNQLNTSLSSICLEIIENREEQFTTTVYISTVPVTQNPTQRYGFPYNMIQWRSMRWKRPGISPNGPPVDSDYEDMAVYDEADRRSFTGTGDNPTWRPEGDTFVLSWNNDHYNQQANINGIQLRGVFLPPDLTDASPNNVIQFSIARILQQFIVYDATCELMWSKGKQVTMEVSQARDRWAATTIKTVDNRYHPSTMQFTSERLPKNTYTGRPGGRR